MNFVTGAFFIIFSIVLLSCASSSRLSPTVSERNLVEGADRVERREFEADGHRFAVAAQGAATAKAVDEIYSLGGNIVDAAVAASFVISVERPHSTGIGGGGFVLLYLKDRDQLLAIDFRERAPMASRTDMFLNSQGEPNSDLSQNGALAVGVPGLVAGLLDIHQRYGKLDRQQVLRPAIRLAEKGFKIQSELGEALAERAEILNKSAEARRIFFRGKRVLREGEWLIQKNLGKTLRDISREGLRGFYRGRVGNAILVESRRLGGLLSQADFDDYEVKYREPVRGQFLDYEIFSMPPPSSGGVHVIQILNILEGFDWAGVEPQSARAVHRMASAMQLAFADRAQFLGDADFVHVPVSGLISKKYASRLRSRISENAARPSKKVSYGPALAYESSETTHFSIMDRDGNVVATTQTINGPFGSGVVVPGTGVVLNNEMDDFSAKPGALNMFGAVGSRANEIKPGKRPLSSMSPTIIFKEKSPIMALGSPAGTRILTCVAQTIFNHLQFGLDYWDSVHLARFHHQWIPDRIRTDPPGLPESTERSLKKLGYQIQTNELGCRVQVVGKKAGKLKAVSDARGQGRALAR